jgi:hypothetical protein
MGLKKLNSSLLRITLLRFTSLYCQVDLAHSSHFQALRLNRRLGNEVDRKQSFLCLTAGEKILWR